LKLLVVLNPHARAGRAGRLQPDLQAAFARYSIETEFHLTRGSGDATERVAGLEAGRYSGVLAGGGDGTLFEVLNGLYRLDADQRPPLGLLPLGTGNAFARDLGLEPFEWEKAVEIIAAGHVRRVDVGQVSTPREQFHFVNIIGWGFVVDAGLAARRYKIAGNGAYTLGVLTALARMRSRPLIMELDGELIEQDNLFVEVSNSRYTGTRFLMAPGAVLDDGLLDVTLVRRVSRRRLLRLFPTIFDGRHVDCEEVTTRQASHIRLSAPEGLPLMPDGEFFGKTPLEIRCLQQDLELYFPLSAP